MGARYAGTARQWHDTFSRDPGVGNDIRRGLRLIYVRLKGATDGFIYVEDFMLDDGYETYKAAKTYWNKLSHSGYLTITKSAKGPGTRNEFRLSYPHDAMIPTTSSVKAPRVTLDEYQKDAKPSYPGVVMAPPGKRIGNRPGYLSNGRREPYRWIKVTEGVRKGNRGSALKVTDPVTGSRQSLLRAGADANSASDARVETEEGLISVGTSVAGAPENPPENAHEEAERDEPAARCIGCETRPAESLAPFCDPCGDYVQDMRRMGRKYDWDAVIAALTGADTREAMLRSLRLP